MLPEITMEPSPADPVLGLFELIDSDAATAATVADEIAVMLGG